MRIEIESPLANRTTPPRVKVATVYPTGRFSIAAIPSRKRKSSRSVLTNNEKEALLHVRTDDSVLYAGRPVPGCPLLGLYVLSRTGIPAVPSGGVRLGSSNVLISNSRAKRGSGGINWGQRDRLSWAVQLMEWKHGKQKLSFLTLTLPPLPPEDRDRIREAWPEIVNRFIIYLKRSLSYRGIRTSVVGATEIQVKRSKEEGWAVPHLHLVFRGRRHRRSCWAVTPNVVRKHWLDCIKQITGIQFEKTTACENLQQVRVSASSYLSKYLSKCASKGKKQEPWYDWHPADWVVLGRDVRKTYNKLTIKSQELVDSLLEKLLHQPSEYPSYLRPIEVKYLGNTLRLGWVGTAAWLATSFQNVVVMNPSIM